jgi:hypothetical protein
LALFIFRSCTKTRYRDIPENHNRLVLQCAVFNIQKVRALLTGKSVGRGKKASEAQQKRCN